MSIPVTALVSWKSLVWNLELPRAKASGPNPNTIMFPDSSPLSQGRLGGDLVNKLHQRSALSDFFDSLPLPNYFESFKIACMFF